jgi:hypothetical protein
MGEVFGCGGIVASVQVTAEEAGKFEPKPLVPHTLENFGDIDLVQAKYVEDELASAAWR